MTTHSALPSTTWDRDDDRVLRPRDAAQLVGLTTSTLAKLRMRGDGPLFVRLSARAVGYRRGDLARWIAERVVASTSEATR